MRFGIALLSLLMAARASGQLALQAASETYNGQNVSRVTLVANPNRDLASLYSLLTQKTGAPYSQKEIEADTAALQQTGHFEQIKVSVVPEVAGLWVQFILEPA